MRNIIIAVLIAAGSIAGPVTTLAHYHEIIGVVHSATDMSTLAQATIRWKGTSLGAYSKEDGSFSIDRTSETDTLVISYVGFAPMVIVAPADTLHVMLEPSTADEIAVEADAATISNAVLRTETVTTKRAHTGSMLLIGGVV